MGIMQQKPNHTPSRAFWADSAIAALALHISAASAAAPVPSAAALNAEIDAKGAKEVVNRLNRAHPDSNGQNDWSRVTNQMWMGRAAYIKLAPKLAPGTDAGSSEDLGISLAHALPLAPITVLRATDLKDDPHARRKPRMRRAVHREHGQGHSGLYPRCPIGARQGGDTGTAGG
jgi:hypothetical protein